MGGNAQTGVELCLFGDCLGLVKPPGGDFFSGRLGDSNSQGVLALMGDGMDRRPTVRITKHHVDF